MFHVMNRATQGQLLFRDHGEYLAFHHVFARALVERPTRLLAYCLMPNHLHMLVWPRTDLELTTTMRWLFATHARHLHRWRGTDGKGAIYQARFRAAPVQTETYFYRAARYVERNAVRAGLAERAEAWPWGSASPASRMHGIEIAEWPVARPADWLAFVNDPEPAPDLDFIRVCTAKGKPIQRIEDGSAVLATGGTANRCKNDKK